jgi:hypothetical protein
MPADSSALPSRWISEVQACTILILYRRLSAHNDALLSRGYGQVSAILQFLSCEWLTIT